MEKKRKKGFNFKLDKKDKEFNITIPLFAQILFTEAVFLFAIISLFEIGFLPVFYLLVGVTLLIMAYNNYSYFEKKYFNGICVAISIFYVFLAIYFITSTIGEMFR